MLFVVVMLVGLLWNFWSFLILFTVIHFGCWFEFVKLMKRIYKDKYLGYCLFGLIYITMPILMMINMSLGWEFDMDGDMREVFYDRIAPCIIIFSIWINDTMAYLVGSFIGKTPLTRISPKKTWEGTIGGIILCIVAIGFLFPLIMGEDLQLSSNSPATWFIIPGLCAIFGTLGDLLESKLKRMADVKDSGSFMPGHGGFLDRFDSLLVAVPAVWVFGYLFF